MKLLFVAGTRPEAIKLAPVILAAKARNYTVRVLATGQHAELADQVFAFFGIVPDHNLRLLDKKVKLAELFSLAVKGVAAELAQHRPDHIFVQGDTISAAAASLAGFYERVSVAHVEAGLRTYDLNSPWPEEFNRRIIALATHSHFPPTEESRNNLLREGFNASAPTGNTGVDALLLAKQKIDSGSVLLPDWLNTIKNPFVLCTLHRRENFGAPILNVLNAIKQISKQHQCAFVFPAHPNPEVRAAIRSVFGEVKFDSQSIDNIYFCEPLGYPELVYLLDRCRFVLTDSGGIQEEAPNLGKPVLIARESTERPEAVQIGSALCIGTDAERIILESVRLLTDTKHYSSMAQIRFPFGDGQASTRILDALTSGLLT
jgi:UDP-N-acetylglucosamine 2-epimerase (non-hydrolysing)